jgi:plastocyanin
MSSYSRDRAVRGAFVALLCGALFAVGCGSDSPTTPTNPAGTNPPDLVTITIKNGVFSPNPFPMKVGQRVNWLNSDTIAHTATADGGQFDTGSIAPTSAADDPVKMSAAGTITFHCKLHAGETGSIVISQ